MITNFFTVYLSAVSGSILSAEGMFTYKVAKFYDKLLKPINTNEYTTKYLLSFAKEY